MKMINDNNFSAYAWCVSPRIATSREKKKNELNEMMLLLDSWIESRMTEFDDAKLNECEWKHKTTSFQKASTECAHTARKMECGDGR